MILSLWSSPSPPSALYTVFGERGLPCPVISPCSSLSPCPVSFGPSSLFFLPWGALGGGGACCCVEERAGEGDWEWVRRTLSPPSIHVGGGGGGWGSGLFSSAASPPTSVTSAWTLKGPSSTHCQGPRVKTFTGRGEAGPGLLLSGLGGGGCPPPPPQSGAEFLEALRRRRKFLV